MDAEPNPIKVIWTDNPWKDVKVTIPGALKVSNPENLNLANIKKEVRGMIYRANVRAGRAHG